MFFTYLSFDERSSPEFRLHWRYFPVRVEVKLWLMWIKYPGLGKTLSENSARQELLQIFTENAPGVRS
jgi:hypothetical protein